MLGAASDQSCNQLAVFSNDHLRVALVFDKKCWNELQRGGEQRDQMARLFFNILSFKTGKVAQKHNNFAKVGSKLGQIINEHSTIWQRFIKFCQSGEISPNLVTLVNNNFDDIFQPPQPLFNCDTNCGDGNLEFLVSINLFNLTSTYCTGVFITSKYVITWEAFLS